MDLIAKTVEPISYAELTQYICWPQNSRSERMRLHECASSLRQSISARGKRGLNGWKFVNLKALCDTRERNCPCWRCRLKGED